LKRAVRRSVLAIDLVVVVDIDDVSADVEPVADVVDVDVVDVVSSDSRR